MKFNQKKTQKIAWWTLLCLGIGLRAFGLGKRSLWEDEIAQVFFSQDGWANLWKQLPSSHLSPPLDYIVTYLTLQWEGIVPLSLEVLVRLPPFVFSVLALWLIFRDARKTPPGFAKPGWLTLWLFSTSVFLLVFAQEARMYSLVFLLSYLSHRCWLNQDWKSWTLFNALGLWTHYFFPLLILTQVISWPWQKPRVSRPDLIRGLLLQTLAFLLITPIFFDQLSLVSGDTSYRYGHAPNWGFIPTILSEFVFPFTPSLVLGICLSALLTWGSFTIWKVQKFWAFAAWLPMLLAWGISLLWPVATTRNLMIALFPSLILLGFGLHEILRVCFKKPWLRSSGGILIALALIYPIWIYETEIEKEDFRQAAQTIVEIAPRGILLVEGANWFAPVYLRRAGFPLSHVINYYPADVKNEPHRKAFIHTLDLVQPNLFLDRHLSKELTRQIHGNQGYRKLTELHGLTLASNPLPKQLTPGRLSPSLENVRFCQRGNHAFFLALDVCCFQRTPESLPSPRYVSLTWDQAPPESWLIHPLRRIVPEEIWPHRPFSSPIALPVSPSKAQQARTLSLTLPTGPKQVVSVPNPWPPCEVSALSDHP